MSQAKIRNDIDKLMELLGELGAPPPSFGDHQLVAALRLLTLRSSVTARTPHSSGSPS